MCDKCMKKSGDEKVDEKKHLLTDVRVNVKRCEKKLKVEAVDDLETRTGCKVNKTKLCNEAQQPQQLEQQQPQQPPPQQLKQPPQQPPPQQLKQPPQQLKQQSPQQLKQPPQQPPPQQLKQQQQPPQPQPQGLKQQPAQQQQQPQQPQKYKLAKQKLKQHEQHQEQQKHQQKVGDSSLLNESRAESSVTISSSPSSSTESSPTALSSGASSPVHQVISHNEPKSPIVGLVESLEAEGDKKLSTDPDQSSGRIKKRTYKGNLFGWILNC